MAREPVKPMVLVNHVLQDAADYAEHQRVDCKLVASEESKAVSVLGDGGLLQRAFDNVLQNALDHTPPGKSVKLSLSTGNERIRLIVADEGPGAPEDLLQHLFEPFSGLTNPVVAKVGGWGSLLPVISFRPTTGTSVPATGTRVAWK